MSLINDALRRASQSDKNRPNRPPTPTGMEAVPTERNSKMTVILAATVVIALVLAGSLFWMIWKGRNKPAMAREDVTVFAPVQANPRPAAPPVAAPKPVPVAPVAPPKPAPAPVAVAPPRVVAAPVAPVVPPPAPVAVPAAPVAAPVVVNNNSSAWPSGLKLSAIFFSRTNPRVLISGSIYGVGDVLEGATIQKIGKDKVVLEMNGQTKEMYLEGQ